MPMTEDFTAFLDPDEFATTVTVGGSSVNVIFDADYVAVDVGTGVMSSVGPVILCDESDAAVAAVVEGTAVIVNAVNYTVAEIQPDGTGMTMLRLRRA